jgi:hypothetical protein
MLNSAPGFDMRRAVIMQTVPKLMAEPVWHVEVIPEKPNQAYYSLPAGQSQRFLPQIYFYLPQRPVPITCSI